MGTASTQGTPAVDAALWDGRIRAHDHAVVVSLLALGLRPDRAREIAQATWLRLMEQEAAGALAEVELPGLAIRQARYLALDAKEDPRRDRGGRMTAHPAHAALEAYVLGHHDEIDLGDIERHLDGCEECMGEVGREARLELLLHAAGREDVFTALATPLRPPRWPALAAAAVAVAAAAVAVALWRSRADSDRTAAVRDDVAKTGATPVDPQPEWSRGLRFGKVRCTAVDGGLACAAASEGRRVRDDATAEAGDLARTAMLDEILARGGPTIRAQRALFSRGKAAARGSTDRERFARLRHQVAEQALIGRRDALFWEEYEKLDGSGTEFVVFVRFRVDAKEIDELLARYRSATLDGAELVPTVPDIRWVLDPGEQLSWFVHRPGRLAEIGIRSGDVLLMNPRRSADRLRHLLETGEALVWRAGLAEPVPASQLP